MCENASHTSHVSVHSSLIRRWRWRQRQRRRHCRCVHLLEFNKEITWLNKRFYYTHFYLYQVGMQKLSEQRSEKKNQPKRVSHCSGLESLNSWATAQQNESSRKKTFTTSDMNNNNSSNNKMDWASSGMYKYRAYGSCMYAVSGKAELGLGIIRLQLSLILVVHAAAAAAADQINSQSFWFVRTNFWILRSMLLLFGFLISFVWNFCF